MNVGFIFFLGIMLLAYYMIPKKYRWTILLIGSLGFYYVVEGKKGFAIFIVTAVISFLFGKIISKTNYYRKVIYILSLIIIVAPLFQIKEGNFLFSLATNRAFPYVLAPLGISFYTLQIVAYITDIYLGKIVGEEKFFRYLLYVSYFPQIVQGPIPRFNKLEQELFDVKDFDEKKFSEGFIEIFLGWFLKLMIADKAAIIVDTVFYNYEVYTGTFVIVAGVLYSIELYADFQACVSITRGVSKLFGIELEKNFNHPYLSRSIADFWRRWHITLSSWLRDYIYIPLGGNRKGTARKYFNLIIVFAVSGIWHGAGWKFLFWGMMHAFYQIMGGLTNQLRKTLFERFAISKDCKYVIWWQRFWTFIFVMFAWIVFRASSLKVAIKMIISVFTVFNPWILFNDSLFSLGLSWKEIIILTISVLFLFKTSISEENKGDLSTRIATKNIVIRWGFYLGIILIIMVFGTYGFGFDAKDFIYGGF